MSSEHSSEDCNIEKSCLALIGRFSFLQALPTTESELLWGQAPWHSPRVSVIYSIREISLDRSGFSSGYQDIFYQFCSKMWHCIIVLVFKISQSNPSNTSTIEIRILFHLPVGRISTKIQQRQWRNPRLESYIAQVDSSAPVTMSIQARRGERYCHSIVQVHYFWYQKHGFSRDR